MTSDSSRFSVTLEELRQSFDRSFAVPPVHDPSETEDFIAVRVGEDRFAMRMRELTGIEASKLVLPLSTDRPGVLGIAGIRGRLVPVYSLAYLMGSPEAVREKHWLVLIGRDQPVGLSFTELEGYLRVPRKDVSVANEARAHPFTREAIYSAGAPCFVLDIPKVITSIQGGPVTPGPVKER